MAINFVIRTLACSDAQRVMELNAQLGYDADVRQIRVRLDRLGREPAHHLIGVESPGGLVAFAHFFERLSIEKGFDMVIQSLVVDVTLRGLGIGRLLMERIEQIARARIATRWRFPPKQAGPTPASSISASVTK